MANICRGTGDNNLNFLMKYQSGNFLSGMNADLVLIIEERGYEGRVDMLLSENSSVFFMRIC